MTVCVQDTVHGHQANVSNVFCGRFKVGIAPGSSFLRVASAIQTISVNKEPFRTAAYCEQRIRT